MAIRQLRAGDLKCTSTLALHCFTTPKKEKHIESGISKDIGKGEELSWKCIGPGRDEERMKE